MWGRPPFFIGNNYAIDVRNLVDSRNWYAEKLGFREAQAELMGRSVGVIAHLAQLVLGDESFDETGLTGQYDFDLKWDASQPSSLIAAIHNQLGLELVADHRKLDHLVVDSVAETKTW